MHHTDDFEVTLKQGAQRILAALEEGSLETAVAQVEQLSADRDRSLYLQVGKLTRGLHEAMRSFQSDTQTHINSASVNGLDSVSDSSGNEPRNCLAYVTEITEDAANRTMDQIEATLPLIAELRSRVGCSGSLEQRTWITDTTEQIDRNLNDILLAQGYQDLSGQVISRVVQLLIEVEQNLLNLVVLSAQVEAITGAPDAQKPVRCTESADRQSTIAAEGPIINAHERVDAVSGQDDVDELLASLGF